MGRPGECGAAAGQGHICFGSTGVIFALDRKVSKALFRKFASHSIRPFHGDRDPEKRELNERGDETWRRAERRQGRRLKKSREETWRAAGGKERRGSEEPEEMREVSKKTRRSGGDRRGLSL